MLCLSLKQTSCIDSFCVYVLNTTACWNLCSTGAEEAQETTCGRLWPLIKDLVSPKTFKSVWFRGGPFWCQGYQRGRNRWKGGQQEGCYDSVSDRLIFICFALHVVPETPACHSSQEALLEAVAWLQGSFLHSVIQRPRFCHLQRHHPTGPGGQQHSAIRR